MVSHVSFGVWGTRGVERVGNDYPRLVALSHPNLQPDDLPTAIRYYSQHYVDPIDPARQRDENFTRSGCHCLKLSPHPIFENLA